MRQPTGDASPWCFEQLCRAAATGGSGSTAPKSDVASRMLSRLSRDDIALLAKYLVRTKRAVEEEGLLKIVGRGVGGGGGRQGAGTVAAAAAGESSAAISETEKDLLRLRCTGEKFPPAAVLFMGDHVFVVDVFEGCRPQPQQASQFLSVCFAARTLSSIGR